MARLDRKTAIVTGGGRGIGREVARALAREGANVIVADAGVELDGTGGGARVAEEVAAEIRAAGGKARAITADIGEANDAEALVRETVERFGRLDILVNAAGILRQGTIFDQSDEDWELTLRVHLTGTFNTTRFASAHWREARTGGRLINVGSDAGLYSLPARKRSLYSPGPWDLNMLFDRFRQAFEPGLTTA